MTPEQGPKPTLLVLASTYPRWLGDHEPGFVHELARRLTGHFEVIVLCPHAPGARRAEILDEVRVHRYRYAPQFLETLVNDGGIVTNLRRQPWKWLIVPGFILMQGFMAWRLCRLERVDVIHAHWLIPQGFLAALLGCLPGRRLPFVVTSHGADLYALKGAFLQRLKRWVLSRASAATVVSNAMRDAAVAMGADAGKIMVLPMGVDMQERFVPDETSPRSRSELLFVGRLVEKKGLTYLLDAFPLILQARPDVTLTIAGFGPDEDRLKAKVASLGIQREVRFLGAVTQSELPRLYQRAALFVAPFVKAASGDQEGLPVALMEAVACGCPVVVGDIPGIEDLLGELKPEICVDVRRSEALAAKILFMLSENVVAARLAERVSASASKVVDWERVSTAYARLLAQDSDSPGTR